MVLKRLRIKFILINMMMAVLVLATTFGVVCYLDYTSNLNSVYGQLNNVLARVASSMVEQIKDVRPINIQNPSPIDSSSAANTAEEASDASDQTDADQTDADQTDADQTSTDQTDGETASTKATATTSVSAIIYDDATLSPSGTSSGTNDSIIPAPSIGTISENAAQNANPTILVAVYKVSDQGFYTTIPNFSIASINESVLLQANKIVTESDQQYGSLPEFDLCYECIPTDDGFIVAYADATSTHSWKNLAIMLAAVGVAALLIFLLINLFFSRWALRPVAASIKQQQQFTADASHELKTPLTVILANMSILESQPESTVDEQMQWIESTQTEAMRMQLLVNEMLKLARPNEDKQAKVQENPNLKESVDFSDLVEGEVLQFESVAFERGIEMESAIEQGIHVTGDPERLGRMVSTLIDNACKYTSEDGSVDVSLEISSLGASKAKTVALKVRNDGVPISDEDLPHLFDRFYRADKARTSGKGGYGLGLAIGREIAREHKGDITVTSTEREGTVFTVTLPLSDD